MDEDLALLAGVALVFAVAMVAMQRVFRRVVMRGPGVVGPS